MNKGNIYHIEVTDIHGKSHFLSEYANKVLLVVNTASECGYTPQLGELETLYQSYKTYGFEVLAFPSNDFGDQEPLSGAGLNQFCTINYRTSYPIFNKISVKGKQAHPLFQFLSTIALNGKTRIAPKWNFHKYLINQKGELVDYFITTTKPNNKRITKKIESLLGL